MKIEDGEDTLLISVRSLAKAIPFLISFTVHVIVILFIIILDIHNPLISTNKMIVIDFTIEDSMDEVKGALYANISKPKTVSKVMVKKTWVVSKKQDVVEKRSEIEENEKEQVVAPISDIQQASIVETHIPLQALSEQNSSADTKTEVFSDQGMNSGLSGSGTTSNIGMSIIPGEGSESSGRVEGRKYLKQNFSYIRDMIKKNVTYPRLARRMGWEGEVTISFIISIIGSAKDIKIMRSSGIDVLDKSAIKAVRNASPFPEPPFEAQVIIPLIYKLN